MSRASSGCWGRRGARIGLLALAGLAAGCASDSRNAYFGGDSKANVYVAPVAQRIDRVAILPFRAATELIGASVADLFVTEFLRAGRYTLVERGQMAQVLSESELALAGLSAAKAVEVGNMLGADGVIIGTVDEYGTVAARGRAIPVIGMTVRMIDCASGKVVWSADLARRADAKDATLPEHARAVVHEIACGLYQHWRTQRCAPKRASAPASVVAPHPPPAPPAAFALSDMGLRAVTVTWNPPPDDVAHYRIERAAAPDGPFRAVADVRAGKGRYVDDGTRDAPLRDGTPYYYRLVAVRDDGVESAPGPARESVTAFPPDPPASLTADTPRPRAVRLAWTPSPSEGVTGYRVFRGDDVASFAFVQAGETVATNFIDADALCDDTMYGYRVAAVNRVAAVGPESDAVFVRTPAPPAPMAGLAAESGHPRCVPLAWDAAAGPHVAGYVVARLDPEDGVLREIAELKDRGTITYTDRGDGRASSERPPGTLRDGAEYIYRVAAYNTVAARSEWSPPAAARTKPAPRPPAAPAASSGLPRAVRLEWAANPEPDIAAYVVAWARDDTESFRALERVPAPDGARVATTHSGVADGARFAYRIRAEDADGLTSAWSTVVHGDVKPLPDAPANLRCAWENGAARLGWAPPAQDDIRAYRVWKRVMLVRRTLLETTTETVCTLAADAVGRGVKVSVTAVDVDDLESEPSEILAVSPPPGPDAKGEAR
jgi:fibronectin type 3 domain-containing protein/TolB-like protein